MPPALPVRVTLFSAMGENRSDISIGWEALMPKEQLQVISIMGTHHSIVKEPDIRELGRAILRQSPIREGQPNQIAFGNRVVSFDLPFAIIRRPGLCRLG